MENLKALQDELIYQKSVIEEKSGYVTVANTNPSPYEITEGIKTIPSSDLSIANATEADVAKGKTFFAGNSVLKTGTAAINPAEVDALFMYNAGATTLSDKIYYTLPTGLKTIRRYTFYKNYHDIELTLNPELEVIDEYSFYEAKNVKIVGFHDTTNLTKIGSYAFATGNSTGIDFSCLPNTITTLANNCFYHSENPSLDFRFPDSLQIIGQSVFRKEARTAVNNLDLSNFKLQTLPTYCFYNLAFNCNMIIPEGVKTLSAYLNYNGCFKNIEIPTTITQMVNYCFGAKDTLAVSNFYLQTVTFYGETVPVMGTDVFANQNLENNFKIYVPDTVVEEYKSATNFTKYADYIYPMSEKE